MDSSEAASPEWFEHERKFVVSDLSVLAGASGYLVEQGYLWQNDGYEVRVRTSASSSSAPDPEEPVALLTLKGPQDDRTRLERELEIPLDHAVRLLRLAPFRLLKTRYEPVVSSGELWAVDIFHDDNEGLVLAEFEGSREALSRVHQPWWCEREVTSDRRYSNASLAVQPWSTWV